MTQPKDIEIIATGITSLDQARYFAAMGVDWMGFDIAHLPVDDVKTISEWVVGPKMFVEIHEIAEDLLFELKDKVSLSGICLPLDAATPSWYSGKIIRNTQFPIPENFLKSNDDILLFRSDQMFDQKEVMDILREICSNQRCWIEWDHHQSYQTDWLRMIPFHGIVLRYPTTGADPEEVYTQYDLFFEKIEDLRTASF